MTSGGIGKTTCVAFAVIFAGSLFAAPQRASAQSDDCKRLSPWASVFRGAVTRDDQKPRNVAASWHTDNLVARFEVSWKIANRFPRSVLTGHCIELTHATSGRREERCSTENPTATSSAVHMCFDRAYYESRPKCPKGAFNFRVRFTVNCTNTTNIGWSDSVSATRD